MKELIRIIAKATCRDWRNEMKQRHPRSTRVLVSRVSVRRAACGEKGFLRCDVDGAEARAMINEPQEIVNQTPKSSLNIFIRFHVCSLSGIIKIRFQVSVGFHIPPATRSRH